MRFNNQNPPLSMRSHSQPDFTNGEGFCIHLFPTGSQGLPGAWNAKPVSATPWPHFRSGPSVAGLHPVAALRKRLLPVRFR